MKPTPFPAFAAAKATAKPNRRLAHRWAGRDQREVTPLDAAREAVYVRKPPCDAGEPGTAPGGFL
jgi:hypothetical protein